MSDSLKNMQNIRSNKNGDVDLFELFLFLWKQKLIISIITLISIIIGIVYSLSLPNIYTSQSVLAPSSNPGSSPSISTPYSGIASLAGISMPSKEVDKVSIGIEIIKSLDFYKNFIKRHDLEIILHASHGWDSVTNSLLIDSEIYDIDSQKWVSSKKFSKQGKPSFQESHRNFLKNLSITKDPKNGFTVIAFSHYSPYVAKKILDLLIIDINRITREEDISIATKSINFLQEEAKKPLLSDVRLSVNSLIQAQIETITLANAKPEYLLKVLSPPFASEIKSEPSRSIIVIMLTFFGFVLGCMSSAFHFYLFRKKITNEQ